MRKIILVVLLLVATLLTVQAQETEFLYDAPEWTAIELTNARTGEVFTLADFAGKVVYVETMATWCSKCRAQLTRVNRVLDGFENENFIFLALGLETNVSDAQLAAYAEGNGFENIEFAVVNDELLTALVEQFGRTVSVAPSVPRFYIFPDGALSELEMGQESEEEILMDWEAIASTTTFPEIVESEGVDSIDYSAILYRVDPEQSEARFLIDEDLRGQRITVVGSTNEMAFDVIVRFGDLATSQIGTVAINARTLETDNEFRNRAIRSRILRSAEEDFEFIEFVPTALIDLPEEITLGEEVNIQIEGELTIVGVTNEVVFDATVILVDEDTLQGSASTEVLYADYGMVIPNAPGVANVSDEVGLEIEFVATAIEKAE